MGDLLRRAMKEKDLSVGELARQLEIAQKEVYRWLRNECVPPFLVMGRVLEITGKNAEYFFGPGDWQGDLAGDIPILFRLYRRNKWW